MRNSVKCPKNYLSLQEKTMIPKYELVHYQDKLYYVYRRVPENQVKEGMLGELKEFWMCDLILKNKNDNTNILIFLREIPDAVIVED